MLFDQRGEENASTKTTRKGKTTRTMAMTKKTAEGGSSIVAVAAITAPSATRSTTTEDLVGYARGNKCAPYAISYMASRLCPWQVLRRLRAAPPPRKFPPRSPAPARKRDVFYDTRTFFDISLKWCPQVLYGIAPVGSWLGNECTCPVSSS